MSGRKETRFALMPFSRSIGIGSSGDVGASVASSKGPDMSGNVGLPVLMPMQRSSFGYFVGLKLTMVRGRSFVLALGEVGVNLGSMVFSCCIPGFFSKLGSH